MPVDVQLASAASDLPEVTRIVSWADAALASIRIAAATDEICIRVVDEGESRALNASYRKKDKPTNVLSFPAEVVLPDGAARVLGDIVVCAPLVRVEALEQGKTIDAHFAHMVVHGVLHLYGYDHEVASDADVMEKLERDILGRLNIGDPYRESETA